jgi:hypothetical protein
VIIVLSYSEQAVVSAGMLGFCELFRALGTKGQRRYGQEEKIANKSAANDTVLSV